jgi:hypothetical protein
MQDFILIRKEIKIKDFNDNTSCIGSIGHKRNNRNE